jgi:hypothetical protein
MIPIRQLVLVSFLGAVVVSRLWVYLLISTKTLDLFEPHVGSFRVHHITTGLLLIICVGYFAIVDPSTGGLQTTLAILFGIGAGLVTDELWLWLKIQSGDLGSNGKHYFSLVSYIPIVIIAVLLVWAAVM